MKQRLFVDMDGTLAVFRRVNTLETLYERGYFLDLLPIENVLKAVKLIIRQHPEIEVHILSSVLPNSRYALDEKNAWLNRHLPEIDAPHRIFPPCGADKKDYIPGNVAPSDFLLDDYTHNLTLWEPPAKGIKLLNGINHTRRTWQGPNVSYELPPSEIAGNIVAIMQGKEWNQDQGYDLER